MFSTINLKFEMGNSSSISGRRRKKKTEREREGGHSNSIEGWFSYRWNLNLT
jgi:hypothetical protein